MLCAALVQNISWPTISKKNQKSNNLTDPPSYRISLPTAPSLASQIARTSDRSDRALPRDGWWVQISWNLLFLARSQNLNGVGNEYKKERILCEKILTMSKKKENHSCDWGDDFDDGEEHIMGSPSVWRVEWNSFWGLLLIPCDLDEIIRFQDEESVSAFIILFQAIVTRV